MSQVSYTIPEDLAWVVDESAESRRIIFALMADLSAIVLDGSGALIWELAGELPCSDIAIAVSEATGQPITEISGAVQVFLDDLVARKLLTSQEDS